MNQISIVIKDNEFTSFEEFAKNIYLYPNESLKLLTSKSFLSILEKCDSKKFDEIKTLLSSPYQEDSLLFKCQYILNPLLPLCHHKRLFTNFKNLGETILKLGPNVDIYLKDFLKYQLLSYYMIKTSWDKRDPILFNKILELEEKFKSNENNAYFTLGFTLVDDKKFYYRNRVFANPKEIFDFIKDKNNINDFALTFISSQYLIAYLDYLGYKRELSIFEDLTSNLEEKEKYYDNSRKV